MVGILAQLRRKAWEKWVESDMVGGGKGSNDRSGPSLGKKEKKKAVGNKTKGVSEDCARKNRAICCAKSKGKEGDEK